MTDPEAFSWKKFLGGVFSPTLTTKWIAMALNIAIVVAMIWGVTLGIGWVKGQLFPARVQLPDVITADTANVDKSSKVVNETYLPLSNLFSFGSKGKVSSTEKD